MLKSYVLPLVSLVVLSACGHKPPESSAAKALAPDTDVYGTVKTCHDGDTCVIELDGGGSDQKVRFIGIDAPETSGGEGNDGQPLGQEARKALNELIKGKHVKLHAVKADTYGRTLGEVYLGTMLVNVEMVKRGHAETYIWSDSEIAAQAYRNAEKAAKDADRGIWSLTDYERPEDFRARTKDQ